MTNKPTKRKYNMNHVKTPPRATADDLKIILRQYPHIKDKLLLFVDHPIIENTVSLLRELRRKQRTTNEDNILVSIQSLGHLDFINPQENSWLCGAKKSTHAENT